MTPTHILSFQKEKQSHLAWPYASLRYHSSPSCNGRLTGYQIPLDLPPGGARILAEDLFGMLSSIWAPGGEHDHVNGFSSETQGTAVSWQYLCAAQS